MPFKPRLWTIATCSASRGNKENAWIGSVYSDKIDVRQQCQFAQGTTDHIAMGSNCFGLVFSEYIEGITVRRFLYPR